MTSVVWFIFYIGDVGHMRKGVSGDWKNHFTDDLKEEFIEKFYEVCGGSGLVFSLGENERLLDGSLSTPPMVNSTNGDI
jgi:hypothetical protein